MFGAMFEVESSVAVSVIESLGSNHTSLAHFALADEDSRAGSTQPPAWSGQLRGGTVAVDRTEELPLHLQGWLAIVLIVTIFCFCTPHACSQTLHSYLPRA